MADIIRALTEAWERIGGMAVLTLAVVIAAAYVVFWNRRLVDSITTLSVEVIHRNTVASNSNTQSNIELKSEVSRLAEIAEALGSDPTKIVEHLRELVAQIKSSGIQCDAKSEMLVIREWVRRFEAKEAQKQEVK